MMQPFYTILTMIASMSLAALGLELWLQSAAWERRDALLSFALLSVGIFTVLVFGLRTLGKKYSFWGDACPQKPEFGRHITTLQPYFWKFAMNSVTDYFYAKDTRGRYLGQNKVLLDLFGHSSEADVIGKSNYDLYAGILDKDALDTLEENDLRAAYSDAPMLAEERVPKPNGEIMVCESIKCSYRGPTGEVLGMISVSRDITSRKQVERELLKSRAEAQAANNAKSAFLANTSHEIRTPLNGIIGMIYLALQTELTPLQRDYLQKGDAAAKYLLGVLNDILDFSKMEAGKVQLECLPVSVRDICRQEVELQRTARAGTEICVEWECDPDVPDVLLGDGLRIRQVLANLLGNAVKFTAEGAVRVHCGLERLEDGLASVRVQVKDSGIGMSEQQLARLFSPFEQGDVSITRKFGGTGLGLAICRQLVTMMGGSIAAASELGKGSTFTFTLVLPVAESGAEVPQSVVNNFTGRTLEGRRILLAEDNAINRLIASEILRQMGAVVEEAHDGLQAIEMIHENEYDAVLMDIQMPQMDGLTATRVLRQNPRFGALPIIAMTAHAMSRDFEESRAAGMQGHVTKPIDPEVLLANILRCLG